MLLTYAVPNPQLTSNNFAMKNTLLSIQRDSLQRSPWQVNVTPIGSPDNVTTEPYDCLIIGGGITGLTAGLGLQKAGKKVVIADAHTIGFGTTGGTSAHINTFADTTYTEAESAFGEEGAQLFADAVNEGAAIIAENVKAYAITCDYEAKTGYLYAENEDQAKQLDDVYKGAVKVGVPVKYVNNVPVTIPYQKALEFPGQAQFHPIKYLLGLQKAFLAAGGTIFENTKIDILENDGEIHTAKSGNVAIASKAVIYATHIPPGINSYSLRCAPYRSYVIAVKLISKQYPDALIYDMQEPYHYFRTHIIDGEQLLLVGGDDHKTGHDDPAAAFESLEIYVKKYYDVASVLYRWSSQYYIPVDGFPYIGQMPEAAKGVYCATGYNGNGMMLGSIAGRILSDLVQGNESKYEKIFSPSRLKPVAGFMEFVKENADVAYHFVADRFGVKETDSLKNLQPGTGEVVEVDGRKVAAYRDENGEIFALNPVCTHAHCIVNFNVAEKSWDCPCHGARYDIEGHVLTGPAEKDLERFQ